MAGKSRPSTLDIFARGKSEGRKITVLTAYDLTSALLAARGGVDAILVGDSLGMVVLGFENTLPVTMEHTLHHCAAVSRARPGVPIIADMPFGSFHLSVEDTVRQGLRLVKEGGASAVKIEGGRRRLDMIQGLIRAEIPVMGHLGLTPQSVHRFGGYKVQGRGKDAAAELRDEARLLQEAGCFALVLECVPADLAGQISSALDIPTIGIGAGPGCDGQVLVFHDMLGLFDGMKPKFVKRFAELGAAATAAISQFVAEVHEGTFPGPEHTYGDKSRRKTAEGGLPQSAAPDPEADQPRTKGYLADMARGKDKN